MPVGYGRGAGPTRRAARPRPRGRRCPSGRRAAASGRDRALARRTPSRRPPTSVTEMDRAVEAALVERPARGPARRRRPRRGGRRPGRHHRRALGASTRSTAPPTTSTATPASPCRSRPRSTATVGRRRGRRPAPRRGVRRRRGARARPATARRSAAPTATDLGHGAGRHRLLLRRRAERARQAAVLTHVLPRGPRHPADAARPRSTCARSAAGGSTPTTSEGLKPWDFAAGGARRRRGRRHGGRPRRPALPDGAPAGLHRRRRPGDRSATCSGGAARRPGRGDACRRVGGRMHDVTSRHEARCSGGNPHPDRRGRRAHPHRGEAGPRGRGLEGRRGRDRRGRARARSAATRPTSC